MAVTDDHATTDDEPKRAGFLSGLFSKPRTQSPAEPEEFDVIESMDDRQAAMKTIGRSESRFGWAVGILGVFFSLGLNVPYLFGPSQYTSTAAQKAGKCPKDFNAIKDTCTQVIHYRPADYVPFLIIGLVAAAAVMISIRFKRRTPAVFSSLLLGLILASQPPIRSLLLGAPFWIFSGWLMIRARRIQRFGTTEAKAVASLSARQRRERREQKASGVPRERTPRTSATKPNASKSSGKAGSIESGRYTPKKPAPKRKVAPPPEEPKPSRFKRLIGDEE